MTTKILGFGELLLRLSPPGFERLEQAQHLEVQYGGSEANVMISLARFQHDAAFVTRLPDNEIGRSAINNLRQYGVNVSRISKGGNRLGIYFLETGAANRPSKVIYDRTHSAMAEIEPGMINWEAVLEGVTWFHWSGITPGISLSAAKATEEAVRIAKSKNIFISADLNFRNTLWQYGSKATDIMPELITMTDLVSGGNDDSEKVLNVKLPKLNEEASVEEELELISERCTAWKKCFPDLKVIASTIRRSYSASHNYLSGTVWSENKIWVARGYDINNIVDRVGGGDAFMAGLIHGLLRYKDMQKVIDFAVAASTLKHTIKGDINLVTEDEVERLISEHGSMRIIR